MDSLITAAADEWLRARLRVEIGCLRKLLKPMAEINATERGFALTPYPARKVVVLTRPVEEEHAAMLAFLADGESWATSALGLALGTSQRSHSARSTSSPPPARCSPMAPAAPGAG
jgi:hypothetical protein